jgi:hypothetical protein
MRDNRALLFTKKDLEDALSKAYACEMTWGEAPYGTYWAGYCAAWKEIAGKIMNPEEIDQVFRRTEMLIYQGRFEL